MPIQHRDIRLLPNKCKEILSSNIINSLRSTTQSKPILPAYDKDFMSAVYQAYQNNKALLGKGTLPSFSPDQMIGMYAAYVDAKGTSNLSPYDAKIQSKLSAFFPQSLDST